MPINKHLLGALCVIGTVTNLLSVIVLQYNSHKKNSTNWLLQALAVIDSLYLLARLLARQVEFFACRQNVAWLPLTASQLFDTVAPYVSSGASALHMVSVWSHGQCLDIGGHHR